ILAPAVDVTKNMPCYNANQTDWHNYLIDCNIPQLSAAAQPTIYEVQAQRFESNASGGSQCDCYQWFVDTAEQKAASALPGLTVFAGISSNHSGILATGAQLATDVLG